MSRPDYEYLVALGKKNNPQLFNNHCQLRKKLEEMDEIMTTTQDEVANMINVQMRNVFAFALGEELLDEEPFFEAARRRNENEV